jgi:sugar phosphate isomerase/epimerase
MPLVPKRRPHDLGNSDLVMSHFTLPRYHPIDERIAFAAAAGYAGIGLYINHYEQLLASGEAPNRIHELLEEHGIVLAEIEVVRGWAQTGDPYDRCRAMEETAWAMADQFGCRYLQAIGPYEGTLDDAGKAFGALCDRAGDHGLVVGIEFLPFTNIYNATDAMAIVERAGRENGGLCVDIWHHQRGTNDLDLIRAIPGDRVMAIQMSDGPLQPTLPDYVQDCLQFRVPPGEGEFDVSGFVSALRDIGSQVPWSMEVCNDTRGSTDPAGHARKSADAMRTFLR